MDQKLLDILCCPESHQSLRLADSEQLVLVNQALERREILDACGKHPSGPIEGLLVRQDGRKGYVIRNGIPCLLKEEGLILETLASSSFAASRGAES